MRIQAKIRLHASKADFISKIKETLDIKGSVIKSTNQNITFELDTLPSMKYVKFLDAKFGNHATGSNTNFSIFTWKNLNSIGINLYVPKQMDEKALLELYNRSEFHA